MNAITTLREFNTRLADAGLGRWSEFLTPYVDRGAELTLEPVDAIDAELGTTRFGGEPDLPPGTAWPTSADGAPLNFVAQFDLASMPPLNDGRLPATGVLSLFVAEDADGYPRIEAPEACSIRYVPAGTTLERAAAPCAPSDAFRRFHPALIRCVPRLYLREVPFQYCLDLDGDNAAIQAFAESMNQPASAERQACHRWGGVPHGAGDNSEVLPSFAATYAESSDDAMDEEERDAVLEARTFLLVTFDCDHHVDADWINDAGRIHVASLGTPVPGPTFGASFRVMYDEDMT